MRKLAWFAFSFAFGTFLCQYFLPLRFMPLAALACAAAGLALYALIRRDVRRAAALAGVGLALGILWSYGCETVFFSGARAMDGTEGQVEAVVLDFPARTDYGFTVDVKITGQGRFGIKTRAYFYNDDPAGLRPGDRIVFRAKFGTADKVREEKITSFTSRGYLLFARSAKDLTVTASPGMGIGNFHVYLAKAIRDRIDRTFPLGTADFMRALLTGDRSKLNEDPGTAAAMERAGVTHIVAVSGMHVSILAGFLFTVLGHSALAVLIVLPVLLVFAAVSGFAASVIRAVVMQAMVLLSPLVYKESDSLTSLSLAMLLLLLQNPCAIAGVGFQLSFAATLGIILFTPRMQKFFTDRLPKKKGFRRGALLWASGAVSATFGALLLTTPLSAYYFGCVSLIAPLTNLLILWAVSPAFILGAAAVGLSFLWLPAGRVLGFYPAVLVRLILLVVKLAARPFLAAVYLDGAAMKVWFVLVYLAVLAFAVFKWRPKRAVWIASAAAASLCAIIAVNAVRAASLPGYTLAVLDVGQGQSIAVTSGRYTALIDCGSISGEDAGEIAERYVRSLGRDRVDMLILTHYHEDHAGGAERLLAVLDVKILLAPEPRNDESDLDERILAAAEKAGCQIKTITESAVFPLGDASVTVYPPLGRETENERGLMACVSQAGFDTLITGDAPAALERQLIESCTLPDIECLVVGHHGSATSTGDALLDALTPETAVISVGENNTYGHPTRAVLERLAERGIEILRTDLSGTITVRAVS